MEKVGKAVDDSFGWITSWFTGASRSVNIDPQLSADARELQQAFNGHIQSVKGQVNESISDFVWVMLVDKRDMSSFVRLAGASGAVAVILGAYGAHALKGKEGMTPERQLAFETGNRYHLIHSVALMASPLCKNPKVTASLFAVGMLVFCGSCYHFGLSGNASIRKTTPFGGFLLIFGWLSMIL